MDTLKEIKQLIIDYEKYINESNESVDIDWEEWHIEEEEYRRPATIDELKIGDTVIVTNRLSKYIKAHGWTMEHFINKEYIVSIIDAPSQVYLDSYEIDSYGNKVRDYYFPIDTLDIIN